MIGLEKKAITPEQKERDETLRKAFSIVRQTFPLKKGFFVTRPSEGFCHVYNLTRFREVLEFSLGVPGNSYFSLQDPNYFDQSKSLKQDLELMGLNVTIVPSYTPLELALKLQP